MPSWVPRPAIVPIVAAVLAPIPAVTATVVTNGAANTQAVAIAPPTTIVVQVLDKLNFLLVLGEPSLFFSVIGCPFRSNKILPFLSFW